MKTGYDKLNAADKVLYGACAWALLWAFLTNLSTVLETSFYLLAASCVLFMLSKPAQKEWGKQKALKVKESIAISGILKLISSCMLNFPYNALQLLRQHRQKKGG